LNTSVLLSSKSFPGSLLRQCSKKKRIRLLRCALLLKSINGVGNASLLYTTFTCYTSSYAFFLLSEFIASLVWENKMHAELHSNKVKLLFVKILRLFIVDLII
jgi:hypothetical protein